MDAEFRYAEKADLPAIVQTYNATIASRMVTADLEPVSTESRETWFEQHDKKKRPLWTVYLGGRYAGWMSFSSFYGRPAYDATAEVSVYIDAAFRRKGLGRACLHKAINAAPDAGIHTLLGFVFSHNSGSISLFTQMGFSQWALLPEVANLDGVFRDLLILGRKV